ncbi:MAG: high frequency lysogenization protein HflD [candidate division NC10 bacterium]|nr:high frequency lysogenization protein HflD [candidate division NC10 bacterium]
MRLITAKELGLGVILLSLLLAFSLGAFHALEPGHGKTVVAAYLVGSRGTAGHALLLGLIVTATHTAGVYLLGLVTLSLSKYVFPERLYPWLGFLSGIAIVGMGLMIFSRHYRRLSSGRAEPLTAHHHPHDHAHPHPHGHSHPEQGQGPLYHHHDDADHRHGHPYPHEDRGPGTVAYQELLTLGITGGIVPCPAALVVLLSAISLGRIGFGLLLIVAFSAGLALVLMGIGLLMVYARRFMARFSGEGRLLHRLPLVSSLAIALLGVVIAVQSLVSGNILPFRL